MSWGVEIVDGRNQGEAAVIGSIDLGVKQMVEHVCIFPVFLVYYEVFALFCCSYHLFSQVKSSFL